MKECRTDNDGNIVLVNSETDQICMDLFAIEKACRSLLEPMKNRGLRSKIEAIQILVKDINRRME